MADDFAEVLLGARKLVHYATVPTQLLADAEAFREAQAAYMALTPQQQAAIQAEREREAAANLADAQADWRATCDRLTGNAPALAALAVHHPEAGDYGPACALWESDEYDTDWPCSTYTAIKEA